MASESDFQVDILCERELYNSPIDITILIISNILPEFEYIITFPLYYSIFYFPVGYRNLFLLKEERLPEFLRFECG